MRSFDLAAHPDTPPGAVHRIAAGAQRSGSKLRLEFRLFGELGAVRVPEPGAGDRGDRLWLGTCLEAFVAGSTGDSYCELNMSPSRTWAAYGFDAYRQGMRPVLETPEDARVALDEDILTLGGSFDLAGMPGLTESGWRVGLSAVVQEVSGRTSYWALAHPPGPPDFHRADCFRLRLPPTA